MEKFVVIKTSNASKYPGEMLPELLKAIPENDWYWRIMQYDGSFKPSEGDMRFNTLIENANLRNGFSMSWSLLNEFTDIILEFYNFLLIASVDPNRYVNYEEGFYEDYDLTGLEVILEIFESDSWALWSRHSEIMEKWENIYPLSRYEEPS